jgi:hypothetical protein
MATTIPVTKDSTQTWAGWQTSYAGTGQVSPSDTVYFYADILSAIPAAPAGKTIQIDSAFINFHVYTSWYGSENNAYTLQAYRISGDYPAMNEGPDGAVVATRDLVTTPPATAEGYGTYVNNPSLQIKDGWFALDVKDLAQKWVNGTVPNYGVMVTRAGNEYCCLGVDLKESVMVPTPNFTVAYSYVPEPVTIGLLGLGLLGFIRRRKA